ncbi:hypothetical protein [Lentzea sp. E54]|uniref:hypothetical protein n=1 Tax=Lentzea xerophila TaxID=3435883 RepID=UPI003DA4F6DA
MRSGVSSSEFDVAEIEALVRTVRSGERPEVLTVTRCESKLENHEQPATTDEPVQA